MFLCVQGLETWPTGQERTGRGEEGRPPGAAMSQSWFSGEPSGRSYSQHGAQVGSLAWTMVGVFTPWKWANATDRGFPPREPTVMG